jgi:hypothetical protein
MIEVTLFSGLTRIANENQSCVRKPICNLRESPDRDCLSLALAKTTDKNKRESLTSTLECIRSAATLIEHGFLGDTVIDDVRIYRVSTPKERLLQSLGNEDRGIRSPQHAASQPRPKIGPKIVVSIAKFTGVPHVR